MRNLDTNINFRKRRIFVVLVAMSFWLWIGKDLVFLLLPIQLPTGKLVSILVVVILLVFSAGAVSGQYKHYTSYRPKSLRLVLTFYLVCVISGIVSGNTAFTIFKLQSLLISIIVAYSLADKTIYAIILDRKLFLIVGLVFGALTFYFVFIDIFNYINFESIGLRAKKMAHLNIQDYYVVLLLYALTLLFTSSFSRVYVFLFTATTITAAPIIIAINSRMIPFMIGITIIYMIVSLRSMLIKIKNLPRNILIGILIVFTFTIVINRLVNFESRMMRVFYEGAFNSYRLDPRYISFNEAINNFTNSPVYGIGFGKFRYPGSYQDPTDRNSGGWPHNIILELLSELGILGFLIIGLPFGRIVKKILFAKIESGHFFLLFPYSIFVYILFTMQMTHYIIYPLLWIGYFSSNAAYYIDKMNIANTIKDKIVNKEELLIN